MTSATHSACQPSASRWTAFASSVAARAAIASGEEKGNICAKRARPLPGALAAAPLNHTARMSCGIEVGKRAGSRRSEEHTSELQSLMRISYAVFCLKKKKKDI